MKYINITLLLIFTMTGLSAQEPIKISGELQALNTDNFSPPRVKRVWQYTISYMAEDGAVVRPGMPILMFKTDAIQTNLDDAKGKLTIKESEVANNKALEVELFEKKSIYIEEMKMELDKATRKAELPKSILAKNDYEENQLLFKLAQKQYQSSLKDYELSTLKAKTDEQILQAEIKSLQADVAEYTASIASMKMFAKAEGIVMHKTNWQGEKYAVGDSIWGNRRVVEVANLSKIIAKIEITENNIKHIRNNQNVTIKLDSLPDKEFKGAIKDISKVVRIKSKNQPSKILEATVFIDNVDTEIMRPGMRLTAYVIAQNTNANQQSKP